MPTYITQIPWIVDADGVVVGYQDRYGQERALNGEPLFGNGDAVPDLSPRVKITGGTTLGSVLTASAPRGLEVSGLQWLRNGTPISGATSNTYTLTAADVGQSITVRAASVSYLGRGVYVPHDTPAPGPGNGNGNGNGNPPPAQSLTPGLVVFGDSTAYGVNATAPAKNWANLRAARLGLPLLQQAISGTVMQNRPDSSGSPRLNNGRSRYATAILGSNLRSRYAILYGLNDLRYTAAPDTMNLANFITDYMAVLAGLIAAGVPATSIEIGSPVWIPDAGYAAGTAGFTGSTRVIHEQYVAAVFAIAYDTGCKYAPVYEYMRDNGAASLVDPDNIHPNDAGHAAIDVAFTLAAVPAARTWTGGVTAPPPASDTTAPTLISAVVPNGSRSNIVLSYSEALNTSSVPAASAFTLSGGRTAIGVGVSGAVVTVIASSAFAQGDAITISYTPGASPIEDVAGNDAAALTTRVVTNNISNTSDADVDAWLSRVTAASGQVSTAEETAVREFVANAKGAAYFSSFRRLNLFVGDNAASLIPLVNSSGGAADTNVGTTYSSTTGRHSNGTNQYLNTGYIPTQATGGMSIYLRTAQPSDTTQRIPIGCRDTSNTNAFRMTANSGASGSPASGGVVGIWGGTAPGPFAYTTGGMTAGLWHSSRVSNVLLSLYKNGQLAGSSTADVTPANPNAAVYLFAQNGGGTAGAYVAASTQIGAYGIDSGMTDAQAAAYYTHMQALMTALGRAV